MVLHLIIKEEEPNKLLLIIVLKNLDQLLSLLLIMLLSLPLKEPLPSLLSISETLQLKLIPPMLELLDNMMKSPSHKPQLQLVLKTTPSTDLLSYSKLLMKKETI